VVERLIAKRCELKKLLKTSSPDAAIRYKLQRDSMKWLLVCCFGYTGYKNAHFGKIEAHEAFNAVAPETLLVAKEIAEADGFELIHAIVDSLYVWKEGATREDYERLSQQIENGTRLPLAIESIYRYVVLLPSKQYADVPVPNRFFAVGEDGELKIRGLECQRHDTPPLLGRMQHEAVAILAEAHDYDSYLQKLEIARGVFANYVDRRSGHPGTCRQQAHHERAARLPKSRRHRDSRTATLWKRRQTASGAEHRIRHHEQRNPRPQRPRSGLRFVGRMVRVRSQEIRRDVARSF
jgi:DNA polymerase-2